MSISLDALEQRIDQLVAVCNTLRQDNQILSGRITGLETEKQALAQKIEAAAIRLESLMEQLPEE